MIPIVQALIFSYIRDLKYLYESKMQNTSCHEKIKGMSDFKRMSLNLNPKCSTNDVNFF